jgi:hypothetical protein
MLCHERGNIEFFELPMVIFAVAPCFPVWASWLASSAPVIELLKRNMGSSAVDEAFEGALEKSASRHWFV